MSIPAVELFSTSILSNHKIRYRHERYTAVLTIKKVPYIYHDLASDEDAKSRWRRKAKDPQIPGLLVHNEWRGTFDEFEEAVEFGQLELFLGVQKAEPSLPSSVEVHGAQRAVSGKDPSLFPTMNFAPEGSGKRAEPTADEFIASLGLADDSLTDGDVDALLADLAAPGQSKPAPEEPVRRFVPLPEALIKPLRLARMGSASPKADGSPSSLSSKASPKSSSMARYSTSQRSAKALAAEAAALTSNRKTSGALLREAVSQGKALEEAMQESRMKEVVGSEDIDELFASLGLKDVDLGDDELDAFLEQGTIPDDLTSGGSRLKRSATVADRARDEVAAREVAQKAREKGFGRAASSSSKLASSLGTLEESPMIHEGSLDPAVSLSTEVKDTETASLVKSPSDALSSTSILGDTSIIEHPDESLEETVAASTGDLAPELAPPNEVSPADEQQPATSTDSEQTKKALSAAEDDVEVDDKGGATLETATPVEPVAESGYVAADAEVPTAEKPDQVEGSTTADEEAGSPTPVQDLSTPQLGTGVAEEAEAKDTPAKETEEKEAEQEKEKEAEMEEIEEKQTEAEATKGEAKEVEFSQSSDPLVEETIAAAQPDEPSTAEASPVAQTSAQDPVAEQSDPLADKENQSPSAASPSVDDETIDLLKALKLSTPSNDSPTSASEMPSPPSSEQTPRKPALQESASIERRPSPSDNSVNRTRRAIDVSRPNDFSPTPVPSSASKKKRGMSIKSFGLGKDKDKEKVASPSKPAFRHERTISQILREADAALMIDDDYGLDDDDDDKIFT